MTEGVYRVGAHPEEESSVFWRLLMDQRYAYIATLFCRGHIVSDTCDSILRHCTKKTVGERHGTL